MKKFLSLFGSLLLTTLVSLAQDVTGDWNGTLKANGAELRLVLHLTRNPDGSLQATIDSIDQGANGIPVTSATLNNSQLNLQVDAVHGTYEGKVNANASEIDGTWTQGAPLALDFHRGGIAAKSAPKPAKPSDIDGDWLGTLDTGMGKLRLVLHIVNTEDGLTATADSLDQNAKGMPVTTITRTGTSLKFEMKSIGGSYDGTIGSDLASISGTWSQLGNSFPLLLKRVKNAAELEPPRRPQNPVKPYPYREEEVTYRNPVANIELAATITIPQGKGPFPAVLLMSGSGPNDRDESLMGHKPFLVLADYLTRKGIVVLRADKRGVGKSGGDYSKVVMTDFASDADAGVTYLKTRPEVDAHKIGLVGHSEGAIEAPMAAVQNPDVAFLVMMAGPGVPGNELLPEQARLIEQAAGKNQNEIDKDLSKQHEMLAVLETDKNKDQATLERDLRQHLAGQAGQMSAAQLDMQIKVLTSPWFRSLLDYDPTSSLAKLTCPVLVLNGSKDLQVPPEQNLPAIRKALEAGGNKDFEIDELDGLNHLFQTAKTGAVGEYGEIEETMSPVALEKVAEWILRQSAAQKARSVASNGGSAV
jgi:uncharacterized protein